MGAARDREIMGIFVPRSDWLTRRVALPSNTTTWVGKAGFEVETPRISANRFRVDTTFLLEACQKTLIRATQLAT